MIQNRLKRSSLLNLPLKDFLKCIGAVGLIISIVYFFTSLSSYPQEYNPLIFNSDDIDYNEFKSIEPIAIVQLIDHKFSIVSNHEELMVYPSSHFIMAHFELTSEHLVRHSLEEAVLEVFNLIFYSTIEVISDMDCDCGLCPRS